MTEHQLLNLVGVGLLFPLAYEYSLYRTAGRDQEVEIHRRRVTQLLPVILLVFYVLKIAFPMNPAWPVMIGGIFQQSIERVNQLGLALARPPTESGDILMLLMRLGLLVYTLFWLGVSISAQIPVKIYQALFD
jgi:hypothetical protein